MNESFHVFLSHNSKDKPAVRQLAQALQARGLKVWLDEEQLVPGRPWQQALESIIQTAHTAAVLVGKDGAGPWEIPEMRACLSGFVARYLPVIPVLLPGAPTQPELPLFLQELTWVDLRDGLTDEGLNRLEWGITGVKRGEVDWVRPEPPLKQQLDFYETEKTQHKQFQSRINTDDELRPLARLTWLHLSDWHQKDKDFDRKVVRDALIEDIRQRIKIDPNFAQVDFIVFSGDVAFSGKKDEYQAAKEYLFDPVLEATGLSADRLFIIPGNHDLDRGAFEMLPPALQKVLNEEECKKWLADEKKRSRLLEPFEEFRTFVSAYTGQDSPEYASIRLWSDLGGKKVALLGLNSAWMCGRNKDAKGEVNDYGYTLLGEPQIYDALKRITEADVRLVVLHHSFDWLVEFDRQRVKDRLGKAAHFILCGHQHLPQININQGTGGDCVIIPAGASYERRTAANPRYTNAYNFVQLDLSEGTGIVHLRRWSDQRNAWLEDIDSCDGGKYVFDLPKDLRVNKSKAPSSATRYAVAIQPSESSQVEPRMNRDKELEAFKKIAYGEDTQTRLIVVTGEGGMGKSYLLSLYQRVADDNNIDILFFSLGQPISVGNFIDQIVVRFGGEHFHCYEKFLIENPHKPFPGTKEEAWQRKLTRNFFKDLDNLSSLSPVVIFIDQYEKADPIFKNWLTQMFLSCISVRYPIIAVIAGRETIAAPPGIKSYLFTLKGVTVDAYRRYMEDCKINLDPTLINEFHKLLHGRPKEFVEYVKVVSQGGLE